MTLASRLGRAASVPEVLPCPGPVLTWAQLAPSGPWAATMDTTAEMREGFEATAKGDPGLWRGGRDITCLNG